MRKLFTLAAMLPTLAFGQIQFIGDSIKIGTPPQAGMLDYQIHIQNLDNLSQSATFWSDTGTGTFKSPYCNVRVSRTAFDSTLVAHSETLGELKRANVSVMVAAMPGRKVQVTVTGGDYTIRFKHVAYGSWYTFYDGSMQHWPSGNFQEGTKVFDLPYRTKGQQGATVTVHAGSCSANVGRIFYLN